ncbi:BamA/TamA family outer membrane protein [Bosea sp. LjRoot9]|uniref:ShlB/FhaC/HecB family hemolysin secretion/activation protein n=1 Tax=Bosea sp. LjRoot9 TaxID=3342341 RepID=UPI003ECD5986
MTRYPCGQRRREAARAVAPLLAALLGLGLPSLALAQIAPRTIETEAERQRLEIERQTTPPRQSGPGVVAPPPLPKLSFPSGGTTIVLKRIDFDKSAFLSEAELDALRARYLGRKVDLAEIGKLVQEVNDLYSEKGQVTASAILPPQKLDGGVLKVGLIEGRVGKVSVTGTVQTWPWYLQSQISTVPQSVVDTPTLNREVSIFNRLNEVQLRAQLRAGGEFGLTDIELAATEPPRNLAQISYDNQAVKSTGRYQGVLFLKHHGLLGLDDRLVFYGSRSRGSILGSGSYSIPVSPFGTRLSISYTRSAFHIVTGAIKELRPEGISESRALNLSQPIFATDAVLLQAVASIGSGISSSKQIDITTAHSSNTKASGGLSLTVSLPGFMHTTSPTLSRVDFEDKIGQAKRNLTLWTGNTSTILRLNDDIYASLIGAWQYTNDKQLPGDQIFQIGGPTTVRGYPIGAAFGDSGFYGQAELHYVLPEPLKTLDAFVFLDHGITYGTVPTSMRATSVGAGLAWRPTDWATLEGGIARPLERVSVAQRDHELYFRLTLRKNI